MCARRKSPRQSAASLRQSHIGRLDAHGAGKWPPASANGANVRPIRGHRCHPNSSSSSGGHLRLACSCARRPAATNCAAADRCARARARQHLLRDVIYGQIVFRCGDARTRPTARARAQNMIARTHLHCAFLCRAASRDADGGDESLASARV